MASSLLLSPQYKYDKSDIQKENELFSNSKNLDNNFRRESNLTKLTLNDLNSRNSINRNFQSRTSFYSLKHQRSEKELFSNKRKDVFGNEILKGSKGHKVSFIDQISSQKIAEIVLVDTYYQGLKSYNNSKDICQCVTCNIF